MTDDNWKTLRVPRDAYEDAKEAKEEHGRTWGEQLVHGDSETIGDVLERLDELEEKIE